jgi:hypothetical protein
MEKIFFNPFDTIYSEKNRDTAFDIQKLLHIKKQYEKRLELKTIINSKSIINKMEKIFLNHFDFESVHNLTVSIDSLKKEIHEVIRRRGYNAEKDSDTLLFITIHNELLIAQNFLIDILNLKNLLTNTTENMIEKETPFFMVFLENERTPAFKHSEQISAETEAMRLAKLHNKKAYVLATIKSFEPIGQFKITDCRPNDDLPF